MMPMHRAPAVRWARAFALGALTLFIVLGALELALRRDGMRPSIADSKYLWAQHRNMAKEGAAVIILVGSSKFQGAIDPALIERRIPSTSVANLAMHGKSPFPVLSDLARDREVVGTVLVEFMPSRFFRHEHHTVRDTEAHIRSMDRLPVVSASRLPCDTGFSRSSSWSVAGCRLAGSCSGHSGGSTTYWLSAARTVTGSLRDASPKTSPRLRTTGTATT